MNNDHISKEALKEVVTEILLENPAYFKDILTEILKENNVLNSADDERTSRLKALIQEDFDRYDEVFKALA